MTKKTRPPELSTEKFAGEDVNVYRHPAYGMIGVSRVTGTTRLFASALEHNRFVVVRVRGACIQRRSGSENVFAEDTYVELAMSEAQWATFVSSFNEGDGVPCTIQWLPNKEVPELDWGGIEGREAFVEDFTETVSKATNKLAAIQAELGRDPASLSKKEARELKKKLDLAIQDLRANLPFVTQTFQEAMEGMTEQAKADIHAAQTSAIVNTGLRAIAASMPEAQKDNLRRRLRKPE